MATPTITIRMDRGDVIYNRDRLTTAYLLLLDATDRGSSVVRHLMAEYRIGTAEALDLTVAAKRCIERGIEP